MSVAVYLLGALCTATAALAASPSRGRQDLLEWGLQIQAHPQDNVNIDVSTYLNANFTTLNLEGQTSSNVLSQLPSGAQWARWSDLGLGNNATLPSPQVPYANSFVSFQYADEIPNILDPTELAAATEQYRAWHAQYPAALAFTNQGYHALDAAGLATYMQAAQPDLISFDYYPSFSFSISARNNWYSEMQTYRVAGLAGNDGTGQQPIPYAQYLDLYRTSYSAALPSESFVRLQQFASWAFGYTFTGAFIYNGAGNIGLCSVMFSSDGESSPTPVFNYVAEANRESLNLGPALVRLVSTDIRMIPGTGHSVNGTGLAGWAPGANGGNDYLTSLIPTVAQGGASSSHYNDVLVGYFKPLLDDNSDYPYAAGTHFMIVNGAAAGTALSSAQWYHLTFNFGTSGYDALQRLDRDTGLVDLIPLTHLSGALYSLDVNLPGGTGDLFRFATLVPGDLNADGLVDMSDFAILKSHWLQSTNGTPSSGDLNADGKVNLADFGLFALDFENANGGRALQATVCEPSALVLLASGLTVGLRLAVRRTGRVTNFHTNL